MVLGGSRFSPPHRLEYSSLWEFWPNEGDLPGHMGPYKSIQEVQTLLGSWEWDWLSMPLSLKALMRPHSLQEEKPRYTSSPPTPVTDANIHSEPSCGTKHLWCWAIHCRSEGKMTNPGRGYRLWESHETERKLKPKRPPWLYSLLWGNLWLFLWLFYRFLWFCKKFVNTFWERFLHLVILIFTEIRNYNLSSYILLCMFLKCMPTHFFLILIA